MLSVRLIIICITLLVSACTHTTVTQPDLPKKVAQEKISPDFDMLFIASSYNDLLTFKPLMNRAELRGYSVQLLSLKDPNFYGLKDFDYLTTLSDILKTSSSPQSLDDLIKDPQKTLSEAQLRQVLKTYAPRMVISGVSHAIQAQITNQLQYRDIPVVAMYTELLPPSSYSRTVKYWLEQSLPVNEVLIPGDVVIPFISSINNFKSSWITVSGLPALSEWQKLVTHTDRKAIKNALNLTTDAPVLLFTGDYNAHYQTALKLLLKAVTERPDITVIIKEPLNAPSNIVRQTVAQFPKARNVIVTDTLFSTSQLVAISDIVTANDTGFDATLAALSQYQVIFIDPEASSNPMVDHGIAMRATSWSELLNAIHKVIDRNIITTASLVPLGFPMRPTNRTVYRLEAILEGSLPKNTDNAIKIETIEVTP